MNNLNVFALIIDLVASIVLVANIVLFIIFRSQNKILNNSMESLRESTTQWIQNKIKDIQNQQRRKDIELIRRYEYVKDGIEALEKDVESPETDIEEAMRKT